MDLLNKKFSFGFTLIELLVAISIVAVLSAIGFSAFGSVQRNARDAKRKGDIDAIANALEINRSSSGYQALTAEQFSGQKLPNEINEFKYCIKVNSNLAPESLITKDTCPTSPDTWIPIIDNLDYSPSASVNSWVLCSGLEGSTIPYCKASSQ